MIRRPRSLRQSHTERSSPTYILIATKLSDQSISKPYSAATPRATYAPQSERGSNAKPPPESSPAKKDPRTKKILLAFALTFAPALLTITAMLWCIVTISSHEPVEEILKSIAIFTAAGALLGGIGLIFSSSSPTFKGKTRSCIDTAARTLQLLGFACAYPSLMFVTASQAKNEAGNFFTSALISAVVIMIICSILLMVFSIVHIVLTEKSKSNDGHSTSTEI